jgi:salicylate hydroxylase
MKNVRFSKRLTKIEQHPEKVRLEFADGEVAEADVVAGADGIQSTVRAHVLSHCCPDEAAPVYADAYCYRGVISMSEAEEILGDLTDVAKFYFGHGRCAVTYRISGGEVGWLTCARSLSLTGRRSSISFYASRPTKAGRLPTRSPKQSRPKLCWPSSRAKV